jgi:predicted branched-subunit amino acid permease
MREKQTYWRGFKECILGPGWGVFASMIGFGTLASEASVPMLHALIIMAGLWSMPGLIAFVDLYNSGIGILALVIATGIANVRVLPVTIATIPEIRTSQKVKPAHFFYAQFNSVNAYLGLLNVKQKIEDRRLLTQYFVGFCMGTVFLGSVGVTVGMTLAGSVSPEILRILIFVTPLYILLLAASSRRPSILLSIAAGGLVVPYAQTLSADWGVVVGGVLAGTIAYFIARRWRQST